MGDEKGKKSFWDTDFGWVCCIVLTIIIIIAFEYGRAHFVWWPW